MRAMTLDAATRARIEELIASHEVVLFMKGRKTMPQCGFSATVVQLLSQHIDDFATVNVLADPEVREGIKAFSSWPTIPQLYVRGEFVGGADIVRDLDARGQLSELLGKPAAPVETPRLTLSAAALAALEGAREPSEAKVLRFGVSADFRYELAFDSKKEGDVLVPADDGYVVAIDRASVRRARDVSIDFVEGPAGAGFKIVNAAEPPKVKRLGPAALKARLDAGEALHLWDVRTPEERAIAHIAGSTLLDASSHEQLLELPKDAPLVFYCHHGQRSAGAAEYFLRQGYTNVTNLEGGIEAWAREVDPKMPRY